MSFDFGVQRVAVLLQSGFGHAHTAVQVYDALQGSVGLQADDHLIVPVDIAGGEVVDAGDGIGFHVQDSLVQLFQNQFMGLVPDLSGALGRRSQKTLVTGIGGVVLLNEITHVDEMTPLAGTKALPGTAVYINRHSFIRSCLFYLNMEFTVKSLLPVSQGFRRKGGYVL